MMSPPVTAGGHGALRSASGFTRKCAFAHLGTSRVVLFKLFGCFPLREDYKIAFDDRD
jgi:hypothetical protein